MKESVDIDGFSPLGSKKPCFWGLCDAVIGWQTPNVGRLHGCRTDTRRYHWYYWLRLDRHVAARYRDFLNFELVAQAVMRRSTRKRKASPDFKKEQTSVRATGFRKSKQKKNEVKTIDVSTWNLKIGSQQHGHFLTERAVRAEVGRRLSPLTTDCRD